MTFVSLFSSLSLFKPAHRQSRKPGKPGAALPLFGWAGVGGILTAASLLLFLLFSLPLSLSFAAEAEADFVIVQLEDIQWDESADGIQAHILHGNPSEEGLYIMRVRFPDGGSSSPHYHTQDRFITVIEGTWHAGTDASHDMTRTTPIPAGGYMMHPAGAVHYDGSRGGPVIVEIRGLGPVETIRVDPEQ